MKRLLLSLFLFLSLQLAQGTLIDGLNYNLDYSSLTASVTYKSYDSSENCDYVFGNLVIPETVSYDGETYSVTSIGYNAFKGCSGLTNVTIGNSVTSIGEQAFYGCSGLTNVTIGNSVTSIGEQAFYGCRSLTSIVIPNSVISIGMSAFKECTSIKEVTFENGEKEIEVSIWVSSESAFDSSPVEFLYLGRNIKYDEDDILGGSPFWRLKTLKEVKISDNVTIIRTSLFSGCSALTSVEIPNSVTEIRAYAFSGCSALTSVEIPNSVTEIGSYAFSGCSMTSMEIPASVTSIGARVFLGCPSLKTLIFADGEKDLRLNPGNISMSFDIKLCDEESLEYLYLGRNFYYYYYDIDFTPFSNIKTLKEVRIGNLVTSIEEGLLYNCSGLTEITIPEFVKSIGRNAFDTNGNLSTVYYNAVDCEYKNIINNNYIYYVFSPGIKNFIIGPNVKTLPKGMIHSNTKISNIFIPNSVTSIGDYAFLGCSALTYLEIPSSVTSIGIKAFGRCKGLNTITLKSENALKLNSYAFNECPEIKNIYCQTGRPPFSDSFDVFDEDVYSSAKVYVPKQDKDLYVTVTPWSNFLNIVGKNFENGDDDAQLKILPVLFPGESLKLCVKDDEDTFLESLYWESSDTNVISISDKGEVKAIELGSASISATTDNGFSAELEILVIEDDGNASVDLNIVNEYSKQNVYTLDGILLIENAIPEEIRLLTPGIYIIGGKKVIVK